MTQELSKDKPVEKYNSHETRNGGDRNIIGRVAVSATRAAKWLDNWVSDRVEAPSKSESGWYVHTGEGKAIAAGAEARAGAEESISKMLRSRESRLALMAVQQVQVSPQDTYGEYLDAVSATYADLAARAAPIEARPLPVVDEPKPDQP